MLLESIYRQFLSSTVLSLAICMFSLFLFGCILNVCGSIEAAEPSKEIKSGIMVSNRIFVNATCIINQK